MQYFKTLLPLLLSIFALNSFSQEATKPISFKKFTLDNGLKVILHQDRSTPIAAVSVTYHVGSKNEKPNRTGFAHFFEHLMFEGSENIEPGKFFEYVQNAGGQNNAYTTFDETVYYEVLPSNQLELGLWLESERMLNAEIDSTGVETQRAVVVEERKQRLENQPYGSIMEESFALAFDEHPYQWTPIGHQQYIDKAKIKEFRKFYETYYVPNNAILSIAGDIDMSKTKKLVEQYFGDIPRGTMDMRKPEVEEPPQKDEKSDTVRDNIQLPAVVEAYHIPAQGTEDYYPIKMLTTLLSKGKSSRLQQALVDEEQKAMEVFSYPFFLEDPGLFIFFAIANQGVEVKNLKNSLNKEIKKVKNELISKKEFQKLQNQVEANFYSKNTKVKDIAINLAWYELFLGDANLINTELQKYQQVTRKDLKRVANKYLKLNNRSVLYYLPKKTEP